MKLVTANELSYSAFADMIDDYVLAGTPFLQISNPSVFPYFVRTCINHAGKFSFVISPYTRYFLVDDDGIIYAQGDVRHVKTRENVIYKGQLGYGVLPSKRGHGYGKLMCALLLKKCWERNFDSVIITCREDNIASRMIIESNGGQYIENVFNKKTGENLRRYNVKNVEYAK